MLWNISLMVIFWVFFVLFLFLYFLCQKQSICTLNYQTWGVQNFKVEMLTLCEENLFWALKVSTTVWIWNFPSASSIEHMLQLIWEVVEAAGGGAWQEEAGHLRHTFDTEFSSLVPFSTLCPVCCERRRISDASDLATDWSSQVLEAKQPCPTSQKNELE